MSHPNPQIPDHELLRCIGSGSYGEVWLARSIIGTYRAVKVVYRHNFEHDRPYEREFEGMKQFEPISRSHDGLVDILQVGRNDQAGCFYYVMELGDDQASGQQIVPDRYEAKTLGKEISQRGMLPFSECLQLSLSLSTALSHLHKSGLIHRDIKPSNIIFVNGVPKIADIGLVAGVGTSRSFVGTEGYIPPEGPGTAQADIYSLGKVIYEISTGKDRNTFPELPTKLGQFTDQKEYLELNEVVLKACESDLRKRYQTVEEMQEDLLLLRAGKSVKRLRLLERRLAALTRLGIIIAVLAILLGGILFQVSREWKRAAEDRQRQVGSFIAYGTRAMEEGDWLGSLPWFVAALRMENHDPDKEKTHRARIATVLQKSPKLVQMWFHTNPVTFVEFGATGDELLIASAVEGASIWNVNTGRPISRPFPFPTCSTKDFAMASFSPDKNLIVISGADDDVVVWDRLDGTKEPQKILHSGFAHAARFDPTGNWLLMTEGNHAVICDSHTGARSAPVLAGHTDSVLHAAYSTDGCKIVTASRDNTVVIWDAKTRLPIGTPLKHFQWVYYASFSPDGHRLATACFDRTVRVWEVETGAELFPPLRHGDGVKSVEFSPDGKLLLTAGFDFTVRLWNAETGEAVPPPLKHSGKVIHAAFSPDGRRIAASCWDGTVRVWEFDALSSLAPAPVRVTFSPNGQKFLELSNNTAFVREALASNTLTSFMISQPSSDAIFSGDGNALLTISKSATEPGPASFEAQLWNSTNGQTFPHSFPLNNSDSVKALSYHGDRLAIYQQGVLSVHDTQSGRQRCIIPQTNRRVGEVAFDWGGTQIVVVSGARVQIWNIQNEPKLVADLKHPTWLSQAGYNSGSVTVTHAEFSPNGELLVTACRDITLNAFAAQVWDAKTGKSVGAPLAHLDGVHYASFSPDSKKVVTASEDFTAMIWDARDGRPLIASPLKHEHQVHHASFSQDGRWVVSADQFGVARVWDAATGDLMTPPFKHPRPLRFAQFVAQDHRILTRTDDGKFRLWELPQEIPPVELLEPMALLLSNRQGQNSGTNLTQSVSTSLRQSWEKFRQTGKK